MARAPQHLNAALAYLAEHGETQMGVLAAAIGISPGTLYSGLATALVRGHIVKRNEGRSVFYRLPEQGALERQPAATVSQAVEGEPAPSGFQAAAWADGDLDLYGLIELEDGGYRLTAAMVKPLRRLLLGAA